MAQLRSTSISGSLNIGSVPDTGSAGNLWYNSTTGKLNLSYCYIGGLWSTAGCMTTPRASLTAAGTKTSALMFGGFNNDAVTCTEAYNGSTWSTGGSLINKRCGNAGAGTSNTAAITFGGYSGQPSFSCLSCTEAYNGTSWSSGGALIQIIYSNAGAGTSTSAVSFGGYNPSGFSSNTETYNGFSWSSGGSMIYQRCGLAGVGQNSSNAIAINGYSPMGAQQSVEQYYGYYWQMIAYTSLCKYSLGGAGNTTDAIAFGGYDPSGGGLLRFTEVYNGSSWSSGANMSIGKCSLAGSGTNSTNAIAAGGYTCNGCTCAAEQYGSYNAMFVCEI